MAKNKKNTSKKKTRDQLIEDARQWLQNQGYSDASAKAIAEGRDPHLTIDRVTGRVHWDSDIRDQERIRDYRDSKPWLEDPQND